MSSSSFDEFCFEFQRSWNLFSFFLEKEFILSLFSVYSFKKSPDFGPSRIILWKNNLGAHRVDFAAFFCAIKNWWEKPCVSHVVKYTIRWESDGKKCTHPLGEKIGTNFPGSSNSMYFTALSHATGNWWGNPCILHIIKYTIGCESNGKKALKLWKKYEYQFPRFSTYDGLCRISLGTNFTRFSHFMGFPAFSHAMGNWWENPCISHMMKYTTGWESNGKTLPFYGKIMGTNFPGLSHSMGFADFSNAMGNLMTKPMHFPCHEVYHRMGI